MSEVERPVRRLAVKRCARCGQDHEALEYRQFARPIEDDDGTIWDWWATCPVTGDPVLMRDLPDEPFVQSEGERKS